MNILNNSESATNIATDLLASSENITISNVDYYCGNTEVESEFNDSCLGGIEGANSVREALSNLSLIVCQIDNVLQETDGLIAGEVNPG